MKKINAERCHLLVSTNNTLKLKVGDFDRTNNKNEIILGIEFEHKLSVDDHISELCKKTSRKSRALSRLA